MDTMALRIKQQSSSALRFAKKIRKNKNAELCHAEKIAAMCGEN